MKLLNIAVIAAALVGAATAAIVDLSSVSTKPVVTSEESVACGACNGTGKLKSAAGSETCDKCKGTGKVSK